MIERLDRIERPYTDLINKLNEIIEAVNELEERLNATTEANADTDDSGGVATGY